MHFIMDQKVNMLFSDWVKENDINDEMLWKNSALDQFNFIRKLQQLFDSETVEVISTHMSKSINLPVYKLSRHDLGLNIYLRHNFYDWKISVKSEKELSIDFIDLFNIDRPVENLFFEGFPKELIFNNYSKNKKSFSAEIYDEYKVYMVVYLVLRNLTGSLNSE